MNKLKFIASICGILLVLSLLCSCNNNLVLNAFSTDYQNIDQLKAEEFNIEDICVKKSSDYEYSGYDCYVSKTSVNGFQKLIINNQQKSTISKISVKNGFVLGLNEGEFASGIMFYPATGVDEKPQVLLEDRCIALIKSTNNTFFSVTSWNYYGEERAVSLYQISLFDSKNDSLKYTTEKICDISNDNAIAATMVNNEKIYVATNETLYIVKTNGDVSKINVPNAWTSLIINSMVEINGIIYIGTHCGVLQYEPNPDEFTWFPVEYENVISD